MSRRRSNRVRNSKYVTVPVPVTILDDCEEDHRTCWKHLAAFNKYHSNPKPTKDLWRGFPDEKVNSFVYFDSLWFSMYKSEHSRSSVFYSIKAKQIFSKKYVFLPIVYWSLWNLLIFCNFGEPLDSDNENTCMLFLDSLKTTESWQRIEPDIRKFVLEIYRFEGRTEEQGLVDAIPLYLPDVPQQTNDVQCGSFVLYNIHRFIKDAPENFSTDFLKEDWFRHDDFEKFCKKLDTLGHHSWTKVVNF